MDTKTGDGGALSYKDFKELLLVELALSVDGDTNRPQKVGALASLIQGRYSVSWVAEAARQLKEDGYVNLNHFGGDGFFSITGRGLEAAEEFGSKHGFPELHEEIEERGSAGGSYGVQPEVILEVVPLDRSADAFKALDAEMAKVIAELRGSNSLSAEAPAEASQRVAELEAGRKLLEADQIDRSVAERLLMVPLRWASLKAAEETLKSAVGIALKAVAAYFGFKL